MAHCLAGLRQDTEVEVYFGAEINSANRVAVEDYGVHPMFCPDCKEDIYDYGFVVITNDLDFSAILAAGAVDGPSVVQIRTQDLLSDVAVTIVA